MFSDLSKSSKIQMESLLKPAGYKITYITVPKGKHEYSIKLIEPDDSPVLFRFTEYKK